MFENKKIQNLFLNEEKVEDFIRRYYPDIYKYCFFHLGNRETAEDITQEVFLKFLKSLDSYREYGKLKNYLYVVAKNTIRDFQRKKYEITEKLGVEASCDGGIIELVYIVLQSVVKAGITDFFKIDLHIKCYIYLS